MRILYATDNSENSPAGLDLLKALRLTPADTISILGVAEGESTDATKEAVARATESSPEGPRILLSVVQRENAADEIVSAAEELEADLILLGARSHSGLAGLLLGSVSDRVLRGAHCPVLLARPGSNGLRRVVLGIDESTNAAAAAEFLRRLPLPADCEIRLVTLLPNLEQIQQEHVVVSPPLAEDPTPLADLQREVARERLETLAATFTDLGLAAVPMVRGSDPTHGLLAAARDEGADLLVIGSHGRGPVERFFLGSTSEAIAHQATCSVLVVKPS